MCVIETFGKKNVISVTAIVCESEGWEQQNGEDVMCSFWIKRGEDDLFQNVIGSHIVMMWEHDEGTDIIEPS